MPLNKYCWERGQVLFYISLLSTKNNSQPRPRKPRQKKLHQAIVVLATEITIKNSWEGRQFFRRHDPYHGGGVDPTPFAIIFIWPIFCIDIFLLTLVLARMIYVHIQYFLFYIDFFLIFSYEGIGGGGVRDFRTCRL